VSIFKRFSDVLRSNVNSAIDAAEDPRKVLEQTILDMGEDHRKARQKLLEAMTLLKTHEKQTEGYRKAAVDWENKAMAALKAGSDDLARSALIEKQKFEAMASEGEAGVAAQKVGNETLKEQIVGLERKIEEAKSKKDELIARLNASDMKKKTANALNPNGSAVSESSAFDTFERMAGKIENSEAEVEARNELMGTSAGAEIDAQLKKVTEAQSADEALAALKAKMTGGSAPPSSSVPAVPNAIDDELAKLKAKLGG
jgi:phage shock protein A